MADQKLSQLASIIAANVANEDMVYLVDVSAGVNGSKSVTIQELKNIILTSGSATDVIVGNRTADDTLASPANTGTLTQLFGWFAGRIKAITGKASWLTAPAISLEGANTAIASKEPSITSGTTSQYWRGDKSWQTLNSSVVGLGNVTNLLQVDTSTTQTGIGGNKTFTGVLNISNSTASTSTTTGALVVDGGGGFAGNIYANGGYFSNICGAGNQTFDFTNSTIKAGVGTSGQDAVLAFHCSGTGLGVFGFDFSAVRFVVGSNAGFPIELCTNVGGTPGADNIASATAVLRIQNSNIICPVLPTSSAGLPSGALWRNGNVVNVV